MSEMAEYARVDNLVSLHLGELDVNISYHLAAKPREQLVPTGVEVYVRKRMPHVAEALGERLQETCRELVDDVIELRWSAAPEPEPVDDDIDWE